MFIILLCYFTLLKNCADKLYICNAHDIVRVSIVNGN